MSYMTAMHAIANRTFQTTDVTTVVGDLKNGPAHYTHAETQAWWSQVLAYWPVTTVTEFASTRLADGTAASTVDLNDLVAVAEFQSGYADSPFYWNAPNDGSVPALVSAHATGDAIGFKLFWLYNAGVRNFAEKIVPYGIDVWDTAAQTWTVVVDDSTTQMTSVLAQSWMGAVQLVEVSVPAPRAGTYRLRPGPGGFESNLTSLAFDLTTGTYPGGPVGFTYYTIASGLTQSPCFFYLPKGTASVDLEIWDTYDQKTLVLYQGLVSASAPESRRVDISAAGTHIIPLQPGEDGTVAMVTGNGFAFPYLYSVPSRWAKSPSALLVPRAIVEADRLTPFPP
jgi:hypothetical protein